jgi:hypothetical protein
MLLAFQKERKMKKKILVGLSVGMMVLGIEGLAQASAIFENSWNSSAIDAGAWSQPTQMLTGGFSLSSSASANRAVWYGTMFSPDPLNTGDIWSFDVVFRNSSSSTPSTIFSSAHVSALVTDTGIDIERERAYIFDASFSDVALAANTPYFLSVINTGTINTFRWNIGTDSSYGAFFSFDNGTSWGDLSTDPHVRAPLNFALYEEGRNVPEPATLLLFGAGLAGLAATRRKRTT